MGWEERMKRARELHRPSLKDWEADGLYDTFSDFSGDLIASRSNDYESFPAERGIPAVLSYPGVSKEEFWEEYEAKEIPCVIQGIPVSQQWPAVEKWSLEKLRNDDNLRDRLFKCGEDDDGKSVKVKLKHFLRYVRTNRDDSPLYIFDSGFDEDRTASRLLDDYTVPEYFSQDLFHLISESRRPPYRWFLVGPERSGTTIHVDPLATNAWNTLIQGKKRWVLFPPHVPKHVVKAKGFIRPDEDDEAIHYFWFILPRIKRQAAAAMQLPHNTRPTDYRGFQCYEFTQHAGETVFVPNGWWHAVLNLTDTVGVTQNFCSPRNFQKVWLKTRTGRPRMAWKWLQQLQQQPKPSTPADPDYLKCAQLALQLNAQDNFVMKYDPVEQKRRQQLYQRQQAARRAAQRATAEATTREEKKENNDSSSSSLSHEEDEGDEAQDCNNHDGFERIPDKRQKQRRTM